MDINEIDQNSDSNAGQDSFQKRLLDLPLEIDVALDSGKSSSKRTKSIFAGAPAGGGGPANGRGPTNGTNVKDRFRDLQID